MVASLDYLFHGSHCVLIPIGDLYGHKSAATKHSVTLIESCFCHIMTMVTSNRLNCTMSAIKVHGRS